MRQSVVLFLLPIATSALLFSLVGYLAFTTEGPSGPEAEAPGHAIALVSDELRAASEDLGEALAAD